MAQPQTGSARRSKAGPAAWVLPHEEEELSPDEWSALVGELDEIEALLRASTLHPHIREFALRQVRLLRAALRQYGIAGIKPVEHALERAVGNEQSGRRRR